MKERKVAEWGDVRVRRNQRDKDHWEGGGGEGGERKRGMLGKGNLGERIGGVGTGTPVIEGMLMFEGGD